MTRFTIALLGWGMLMLATGCCCHRAKNPCNPCGPVYGASTMAPGAAPIAYYPATMTASACDCGPGF